MHLAETQVTAGLSENETLGFSSGPLALRRTHVTVHEGKIRPVRTDGVLNPS